VDVGANVNTYARDHSAYRRPDLVNSLYFNTGHKRDQSAFAKMSYTAGAATLFGDLQARHAEFSYTPDAQAAIPGSSIDWTFVNPKVGVSYAATPSVTLSATYGKNTREPARSDMFGGFDNLDTSNVAFVGALNRVKPETVHDVEVGGAYRAGAVDAKANLYVMNFRNEIAPIGALSYIGTPLRKNVGASYRRGVEADVAYRGIDRWTLSANGSLSANRIREYVDSTGDTPTTYRDVAPLLTPTVQAFGRAAFAATQTFTLAAEGRYQGEAFLQNTGDARFVLPSSLLVDVSAFMRLSRVELGARINNVGDAKAYGSGYASGGASYYYVVPPRNVFVTAKFIF
jgi:iron complex outermembrane receptor protein